MRKAKALAVLGAALVAGSAGQLLAGSSFGEGHSKAPTSTSTPTPTPEPRPQYPPYGAAYTPSPLPESLKVNQVVHVNISVRNLSSETWPAGGIFRLAYHWYQGGVELVHEGNRTLMPVNVAPGDPVSLSAQVTAPPSTGNFTLRWDMVKESVAWFSDQGVAMSAPQYVNITH